MATTIKLQDDTKEALRELKQSKESFDDVVRRLAEVDNSFVTESRAREIATEQISERVVPEAQR
jgi:predicted CopG family antitoxin